MQLKVHMQTLEDKDWSSDKQMLDGKNLSEQVGTFQQVVTLEDIQHMDYFHSTIGQLVLMDNGGHWLMVMDIQMNIILKI